MELFQVVIHFKWPLQNFQHFLDFLKQNKATVDGLYQATSQSHEYFQDYSQILLDFGIKSYEEIAKRVLIIAPWDHQLDRSDVDCQSELLLYDKNIINPDLGFICRRTPLLFGIGKLSQKYNISYQSNSGKGYHYDPITLLIPTMQSQNTNTAVSLKSVNKMVIIVAYAKEILKTLEGENIESAKNLISKDKIMNIMKKLLNIDLKGLSANFLEGLRIVGSRKEFENIFRLIETGIFWEKAGNMKKHKRVTKSHLESLKNMPQREIAINPCYNFQKNSQNKEGIENSKAKNTVITYMQLVGLNSQNVETDEREIEFNAEFSDSEYDDELIESSEKKRISNLLIPKFSSFEQCGYDCFKTEQIALTHKL